MKLDEIVLAPGNPVDGYLGKIENITDIDWNKLDPVTTAANMPVYIYQTKDQNVVLVAMQQNDQIVASLFLEKHGNYFITRRAWVPSEYRGRGYMEELIHALYSKLNYKFISDTVSTNNGKKLWSSLSQKLPVKAWNTETNELLPRNNIPDDQIYSDNNPNKPKYLLVLESEKNDSKYFFPSSNGILSEYTWFINYLKDPKLF